MIFLRRWERMEQGANCVVKKGRDEYFPVTGKMAFKMRFLMYRTIAHSTILLVYMAVFGLNLSMRSACTCCSGHLAAPVTVCGAVMEPECGGQGTSSLHMTDARGCCGNIDRATVKHDVSRNRLGGIVQISPDSCRCPMHLGTAHDNMHLAVMRTDVLQGYSPFVEKTFSACDAYAASENNRIVSIGDAGPPHNLLHRSLILIV